MATGSSKSERTEKPTAKRLRDAREKGQIARTKDLTQAASLAGVVGVLAWTGVSGLQRLGGAMTGAFQLMGDGPREIVPGTLTNLVVAGGIVVMVFVGPVAAAVIVMVVASQVVQGGWVFAPKALTLNWSRLSPANGFKRLGVSKAWVDLVKVLLVVTVLVWLAWGVVSVLLFDSPRLARIAPLQAAAVGWHSAERLVWQVVILLLVVSLADYGVQRMRMMSTLKMTKREVRDDTRLAEGSPETKARVRRIQREMARRRMFDDVARATVVVTNPTEFAVALEYDRDALPAPRVLAKGRNLLARRIRDIAREHEIPIVENPPLAQALFRGTEVGDVIPPALFDAVAEVLVYLVRLKRLAL